MVGYNYYLLGYIHYSVGYSLKKGWLFTKKRWRLPLPQFGYQWHVLKQVCGDLVTRDMFWKKHTTNKQTKNIRFGVAKEETFLAFFDATIKRMDGKKPVNKMTWQPDGFAGGKGVLKK